MTLVDVTSTEATGPLNDLERQRLAHEEAAIEKGAAQIGAALMAIRDQRLYREQFDTFELYCLDRWGIGRNYANKQIAAAKVVAVVGTDVPIREAHARELAPLLDDPELLIEVWETAVAATDNGRPSAVLVRDIREQLTTMADDGAEDPVTPRRQQKSRRAALPDAYLRNLATLRARAESLTRLTQDDRWSANRATVTGRHGSAALNVLLNVSSAVAQLDAATLAANEEARQWWLTSLNEITDVLHDFGQTLKES